MEDADPVFSTKDVEILCAALSPHFERHIIYFDSCQISDFIFFTLILWFVNQYIRQHYSSTLVNKAIMRRIILKSSLKPRLSSSFKNICISTTVWKETL